MNAKWESAGERERRGSLKQYDEKLCMRTDREGGQSVRRRQAVTDRSADRSGLRDAHVARDIGGRETKGKVDLQLVETRGN